MNTYQETHVGNGYVPGQRADHIPERLLRALEAHAAAEAESVSAYQRLADDAGDPLVTLLMGIVLEDEERHHSLLERMAKNLEADPSAVEVAPGHAANAAGSGSLEEIISTTRGLIREEREGARYLRHLARQEPRLYDGAYALLLETMARDSEKHEHILRFILRRLEARV